MIFAKITIDKCNHPVFGTKMTFWAKTITIVIFLALLLATGSVLAFLLPLPVAHGLSVLGGKN